MLDSDCCTSINRNILECKYIYCRKTNSLKTVLIETYWNVNPFAELVLSNLTFVLIETYWNVNANGYSLSYPERSINRNILECKYEIEILTTSSNLVLIETYWNVNLEAVVIVIISGSCINRNILECKFLRVVVQAIQPVGINRNILECK